VALREGTEVLYKTTDFYRREAERAIRWDDPELGIAWPSEIVPILSDKDAEAPAFRDATLFE
jgi:dTDP-4-dehydrorhamnose 3,5-epimerase